MRKKEKIYFFLLMCLTKELALDEKAQQVGEQTGSEVHPTSSCVSLQQLQTRLSQPVPVPRVEGQQATQLLQAWYRGSHIAKMLVNGDLQYKFTVKLKTVVTFPKDDLEPATGGKLACFCMCLLVNAEQANLEQQEAGQVTGIWGFFALKKR